MLERPQDKETVEKKAHMEKILTELENDETRTVDAGNDSLSKRPLMVPKTATPTQSSGPSQRTGRWTPDEKILFLYGLKRFGKGRWKKMSVYLPHRSLVQIKSHAQKVLKRLEAGENVFRRLEENYNVVDSLIVQAAKQRDSIGCTTPLDTKSLSAKSRKRAQLKKSQDATPIVAKPSEPQQPQQAASTAESTGAEPTDGTKGAVTAAAALCLLSSLGNWDKQQTNSPLQEV